MPKSKRIESYPPQVLGVLMKLGGESVGGEMVEYKLGDGKAAQTLRFCFYGCLEAMVRSKDAELIELAGSCKRYWSFQVKGGTLRIIPRMQTTLGLLAAPLEEMLRVRIEENEKARAGEKVAMAAVPDLGDMKLRAAGYGVGLVEQEGPKVTQPVEGDISVEQLYGTEKEDE